MELRIELASVVDAPLVHRVMQEAFAEYWETLQPPSGAHAETVDDVARAIGAGGAALVWADGVPVASARFLLWPDHLEIGRVAVLPAYRRRGIASALMAFLEGHGRRVGQTEVRVGVRRALPGNIALYARLGYAIVGEHPHPHDPRATSVVMAKRL